MCRWHGGEQLEESAIMFSKPMHNCFLHFKVGGLVEAGASDHSSSDLDRLGGEGGSAQSAGRLTTIPSKSPNTALIDCSWTGHSWGNSLSWQLCCWWWKGHWMGGSSSGLLVYGIGSVLGMPQGKASIKTQVWNASVKTRVQKI